MRRLNVLRNRMALWLLGLPLDTKGICLPGTLKLPPNAGPVHMEGFQFILLQDVPALKINLDGTRYDLMGGVNGE